MTGPSSQAVLAGMAMVILGTLSCIMAWHEVPQANHDYLVFILGALSGALTVGGASKIADRISNNTGGDTTIQPATPPVAP